MKDRDRSVMKCVLWIHISSKRQDLLQPLQHRLGVHRLDLSQSILPLDHAHNVVQRECTSPSLNCTMHHAMQCRHWLTLQAVRGLLSIGAHRVQMDHSTVLPMFHFACRRGDQAWGVLIHSHGESKCRAMLDFEPGCVLCLRQSPAAPGSLFCLGSCLCSRSSNR